jgi:hypothetical protein
MNMTELLVLVDVDVHDSNGSGLFVQLNCILAYVERASSYRNVKVIWYVLDDERFNALSSLVAQDSLKCQFIIELIDCACDEAADDCFRSEVDAAIRYGRHFEYESAIERKVPAAIEQLPLWYFGVVPHVDFSKNELNEYFAEVISMVMPASHQSKTMTWVSLLENVYVGRCLPWLPLVNLNLHEVIWVIQLLHAFEAASGNALDEFDLENTLNSLGICPADIYIDDMSTGVSDTNCLGDVWMLNRYEKRLGDMASLNATKHSRFRELFPTAESLMYSLWYSSRSVFTMSCFEKSEFLISFGGGADIDFLDRVSAYDCVKNAY